MFHSARLRLTAWYLVIIMAVSISFSIAVYRIVTFEVERVSKLRPWPPPYGNHPPPHPPPFNGQRPPPPYPPPPPREADPAFVAETKKRMAFMLVIINLLILASGGAGAYFLAGRTLKPIKEMLEEQNRFIADASHELRTPLTAIRTSTEVGLRDPDMTREEALELLKENLDDVNRLQLLADRLLRLAQCQRGVSFEPASLSATMEEAIRLVHPLAKDKNIAVTVNEASFSIEADRDALRELFVILLDNAVKYSPKKSRIAVKMEKSNTFTIIEVKDEGMGMDARDIPHIFDRFYRADKSRSSRTAPGHGPGYGLGLSIAKKIVQEHHGSITVTSAPGKGSTFTVKLPSGQNKPLTAERQG